MARSCHQVPGVDQNGTDSLPSIAMHTSDTHAPIASDAKRVLPPDPKRF